LIEVEQLVFEYPGHRALDGVSLRIGAGSVTALVGPNGAGKTTLMRCIAGLEQPLSGGIRVQDIAVEEHPREVHRHLGYLSDFYGLYDRLSVARCLRYCALAMGVAAHQAETRVQEVAAQLGLSELLQRRPTELSRGQRQRVAIGQAIVHQPAVLLLDEPASGLDPEARGSLSQLFRRLQAQGMTLVVSSHILSELDEYCTHILSLRAGLIESHEALQAAASAGPDGARAEAGALYALEIAPPPDPAQAAQTLRQALQGVTVQQFDATGARPTLLWLPAAPAARAHWLAALVQAGVPVAGLTPVRERLQDRYARTISNQEPA
jgi:ABC-2 type transport system ATP-binding protein